MPDFTKVLIDMGTLHASTSAIVCLVLKVITQYVFFKNDSRIDVASSMSTEA